MVHVRLSFLKLLIFKREKKDGDVGPLARIILKIIYFTLHSVADFMHTLGQAAYFLFLDFLYGKIEITLIYSFPHQ